MYQQGGANIFFRIIVQLLCCTGLVLKEKEITFFQDCVRQNHSRFLSASMRYFPPCNHQVKHDTWYIFLFSEPDSEQLNIMRKAAVRNGQWHFGRILSKVLIPLE